MNRGRPPLSAEHKSIPLSMRIPPEMSELLTRVSYWGRVTKTSIVIRAVASYIKGLEETRGKPYGPIPEDTSCLSLE